MTDANLTPTPAGSADTATPTQPPMATEWQASRFEQTLLCERCLGSTTFLRRLESRMVCPRCYRKSVGVPIGLL